MTDTPQEPVPTKFRFRLRTLLLLVTLLAIFFGWLGFRYQQWKLQARAANQMSQLGGVYIYDRDFNDDVRIFLERGEPGLRMGYAWIRSPREVGIFANIVAVDLSEVPENPRMGPGAQLLNIGGIEMLHSNAQDEDLACLSQLRYLSWLTLENSDISDQGLQHLMSLENLKWVNLKGTQVTDQGVEQLQARISDCKVVR